LTTKKHIVIVLAVSACISIGLLLSARKEKHSLIQHSVFHCVNGWGYDILVDGKLFIRQESVPVLSGSQGFDTKEQAEETARLIINKMKRGEEPTVTTFEIGLIYQPKNKRDDRSSRDQ
jgi:Domain of unknown function (DUF4907)